MAAARSTTLLLVAVGSLVAASVGSSVAAAARVDAGVLNQSQATDPTGDANGGPDLSSLGVTTYTDGTITFVVQLANRNFLQPGETVQIFIDLNDDGTADLKLSIWSRFSPSYLARASGTSWVNVRQLPELVQAPGSVSVNLSLAELQSDAAVSVTPMIQVTTGSWTEDSTGTVPSTADDWLPNSAWLGHSIKSPATTSTTTTAASAPATTTPDGAPAAKRAVPGAPLRPPPSKGSSPPLTIEPLAPLTTKPGKDFTLHVLLKSGPGPMRTFKVCAQTPPASGLLHSTQCRSTRSTGASGAVPFSITYRIDHPGTAHIAIEAAAGSATARSTAIVDIVKA
jgi:hypothetical protein